MKRFAVAACLSVGLALPAAADTLDELFANTLTLTDSGGNVTTILVSEGGALEQVNGSGVWAAGFWSKEEGRFCWTARGASQVCIPLASGKAVGDSWEISGPTGLKVWTAAIVEGRANLKDLSAGAPE